MKRPTLVKISISTTSEAEEAVSEMMENAFNQPPSIYHDLETARSNVSVYLDKPVQTSRFKFSLREGLLRIQRCGLNIGSAEIAIQRIKHNDWAEAWKRHFKPLNIGSVLLIRPSWSKRRPKPGQACVVLDPGLSFGTGQHPTTRFCLEQLAIARRKRGTLSFLDIGTGSGILAIAAAKLGYGPIHAFDFDAEAVRIARENARKNRVHPRIQLARLDLTAMPVAGRQRFDVVCANLTHDLLTAELRRILNRVRPGGILVLAGILASQFRQVAAAYEACGWKLRVQRTEKEWQSGIFSRDS